jgi:hypothetical protein
VPSELFARREEEVQGPLPWTPYKHLVDRIQKIDDETKIIDILDSFDGLQHSHLNIGDSVYIITKTKNGAGKDTKATPYNSFAEAIRELGKLEYTSILDSKYDFVIVRNVSGGDIQSAYLNYSDDARDFLRLLRKWV